MYVPEQYPSFIATPSPQDKDKQAISATAWGF